MTHKRTTYLLAPLLLAVVFLFPKSAAAASPSWPPLPTYSPVNTFTEVPTATVPANLMTSWRGIYTLPAYSLLERRYTTLREIITSSDKPGVPKDKRTYKYNPKAIYEWTKQLADGINSPSAEPAIKIENDRVTEFTAPQTGRSLDRYHSTLRIIEALQDGQTTITLVMAQNEPSKQLSELNNLGIKELVGRGESKFNGSPRNRRHNIAVGVSKMRGIIIQPDEEFSFNKYLGPVEAYTGFLPELVIKKEGTVPEFGGGLCQVSSTTFRAAMHAGLPITQRRNHSYAVQYYAPQGSDATIYPGAADLRFINDTGHSILVWPYLKDSDTLIFDFYGTFDNRKVVLDKPVAYDRRGDGSMKAYWTRTVTTKDGEVKKDQFNSVYQPPALFHKQETFVSSEGIQQPTTPATQNPPPPPATNTNNNTSNDDD